ncbi:DUF3306 domain-containing protein [Caldimonas aquatica]|uniref:DUF3306 domain-containing protein n=1 Tax=Caldimonas aquatica TaxID=376175 RepID=A0ABY6MVB1_9BURK|nr:DUF3306 domain-containing protein [Schlegelella aquatica]UZD55955.1 DUF3306 domain-containing protein [Schlegelella aquatica]
MTAEENFFSRWARRKAQVARGEAPPEPQAPAEAGPPPQGPSAPADATAPAAPGPTPAPTPGGAPVCAPGAAEEPPPTMEDVERLTPTSDYSRFAREDVDEDVRRAAFRKLFSDPHFNRMDGLDVYIDDYSKPNPIPPAMLRKMVQSRLLGLFRDEDGTGQAGAGAEKPLPPAGSADGAVGQDVPQSGVASPTLPGDAPGLAVPHDEDAAVQLQPDDAARRPGTEPGPGVG